MWTVSRVPTLDEALLEIHFDPDNPASVDSVSIATSHHSMPIIRRTIRGWRVPWRQGWTSPESFARLYPEATRRPSSIRRMGRRFAPFYEYEYVIDGLQVAEPVFIAVTAFDHGDPASRLASLESSRSVTAQEIWPINSATVVKTERPKPGVYPNPYRTAEMYYDRGWENRGA